MLRSFEAAARHVSFARAAGELSVTAAAISQQVRALEEHLGQPLFLRRPHGLSLTETGLSYLTIVRDAFDRLGAGTDELFQGRTKDAVSVRVTAGFAHLWLAPRLHRFLAQEPGLQIRLLTTLWTPLEIDRDADFEIRCGIGCWPKLSAYPLTQDQRSVRGRLIEDDDKAHDLAVSDLEVVRQDQLFRQVRFVVVAVIGAAHNRVAIVVEDLTNLDRHMIADHFLLDPAPDRIDPDDLAPIVVDIGVLRESCDNRVGIGRVNRTDVFGNDAGKCLGHDVSSMMRPDGQVQVSSVLRPEEGQ